MGKIFKILTIIWVLYHPSFSHAQSVKTLTIYTTHSFSLHGGAGKFVKELFEKKYNCKVKMVVFDHAISIISRLKFEKKSTKADLVLGLDFSQIDLFNGLEIFDFHDMSNSAFDLPLRWTNPLFIPYCYGYIGLIYNADKLSTLPKNFNELLDPKNKLRIIIPDPRTSSLGFDFLIWTNGIFKDQYEEKWKELIKKVSIYTKGWSEAWSLFMEHEADLVLSYDTSAGYHQINGQKYLLKELKLEEAKMVQLQVAAKLKFSQEQELAKQFLQFLMEPEIQKLIAEKNFMHPVIGTKKNLVKSRVINIDKCDRKELIKKWIHSVL